MRENGHKIIKNVLIEHFTITKKCREVCVCVGVVCVCVCVCVCCVCVCGASVMLRHTDPSITCLYIWSLGA